MDKSSFKKPPSKQAIRESLDKDVDAFLQRGGDIHQVQQGETGLEARSAPLRAPLFNEPKTERTPVDDVIAALDERRDQKRKSSAGTRRGRKPRRRKQVIYDDFGEALRTVWIEE